MRPARCGHRSRAREGGSCNERSDCPAAGGVVAILHNVIIKQAGEGCLHRGAVSLFYNATLCNIASGGFYP